MGADRFAIPEVLFNPPVLGGYPQAAEALATGGASVEALQGIHHMAHECISK